MTGRVASIGECMVELRERPDGLLERSHGGDTLNTAVYLARLGIGVDYVTALGDDPWSDEMMRHWQQEGIGTGLVHRLPGRLPGLYIIETDAKGERRFLYWRDSAAARLLWDHLDPAGARPVRPGVSVGYHAVDLRRRGPRPTVRRPGCRQGPPGVRHHFRPRGWPDLAVAHQLYRRMFELADIVLASAEDLRLLFGDAGQAELLRHAPGREIVLKLDEPASRVVAAGLDAVVQAGPVAHVVDTTAAGDSFSAAYLAARLRGSDPVQAARAGHALAGVIVGHPGAIIPRGAMPTFPLETLS